jgi:hypothetical protein
MPTFISVHVTTCMTRQEVEKLTQRFVRDADGAVALRQCICNTIKGRMVCIWEASDAETLTGWLQRRQVKFRSEEEWLMEAQIDLRPIKN